MKIEKLIEKTKEDIVINVHMAEEQGWKTYYQYVKAYVERLNVLKAAKKVLYQVEKENKTCINNKQDK